MIRLAALALLGSWAPPAMLAAQHKPTATLSGQAVFIYTTVDPIPGGGTLGEVRLVQPIVMLDAALQEAATSAGIQLTVEDGAIFLDV